MKKIQKDLHATLIDNHPMSEELFLDNLSSYKDEFFDSLQEDNEDVIFAVDHHQGSVAMLLIEKTGASFVNENARDRLRHHWKLNYEDNLKQFIPFMAQQLQAGEFGVLGFNVVDRLMA